MFVRVCGFAFIIVSSGMIGLKLSRDYIVRIDILYEIKKVMNILKNEIVYNNESILDAISKSAISKEKIVNNFLLEVINIYKKEPTTIKQAWDMAVNDILKVNSILKDEDLEIIKNVANNLGTTCRATQIDNIDNFISKIDIVIEELEKPKKEKCKMYKTMGVMAGLMIVILFV